MIDILKVESDLKKKEQKIAISFILLTFSIVFAIAPFCYLSEKIAAISGIIFASVAVYMLIRFLRLIF